MADWYYRLGEEVVGPVDARALIEFARGGQIDRDTPIRKSESGRWAPAAAVKGLFPDPPDRPLGVAEAERSQPTHLARTDQASPAAIRAVARPALPVLALLAGATWLFYALCQGFGAYWAARASWHLSHYTRYRGLEGETLENAVAGLAGLAFFLGLFAVSFGGVGMATLLWRAPDTRGNGIGSIVFGLLQLAALAGLVLLSGSSATKVGPSVAGLTLLMSLPVALIGAGILALVGRRSYLAWRDTAPSAIEFAGLMAAGFSGRRSRSTSSSATSERITPNDGEARP